MTTDDQYVPSDEDMEERYVRHSLALVDFPRGDRPEWEQKLREEFRRGLARVRRDAAREALNGLAGAMMDTPGIGPGTKTHRARMRVDVVTYRDIHYPEGAEHG